MLALVVFLLTAWLRTRKTEGAFARDRFAGYAMGAWTSGMLAGLTMSAINWSGSLGAFSRWIDGPIAGAIWSAMIVVLGPLAGFAWNRSRRNARAGN
jgi:hypothetical protein